MTESMTRTDAAAILDCPEEVLNRSLKPAKM